MSYLLHVQMPNESGPRLDLCRRLLFGKLAIGNPSNGKTPVDTVNLKVGYFLTGQVA